MGQVHAIYITGNVSARDNKLNLSHGLYSHDMEENNGSGPYRLRLESWIYLTKQTFALDHLFRCKERIWICLDVDRESC